MTGWIPDRGTNFISSPSHVYRLWDSFSILFSGYRRVLRGWTLCQGAYVQFYQHLTNILELEYAPGGQAWFSAFSPWTHCVSITGLSIYEYPYTTYNTINSPRIIIKLPTEFCKVLVHVYSRVCWRLSSVVFVKWFVTESRHSQSSEDSFINRNLTE